MPLFGLPPEKIRVIQTETGGGFGGKEEYPSMIAGARGAARVEIGQAREDDLRSRRGHGRDHQAPSVAHAASHRRHARRQTARDGHRFRHRRRRVRDAFCRWCSRAARFTPRGRITAPTCAFAAAPSPPMRRRTARSADSARRRASSRSSGTWTRSRSAVGLTPEEFRRRNFLHHGQTTATGQVIREDVDHGARCSIARSASSRLPRQARALRAAKIPALRDQARHRLRAHSCTAPASPARAKCYLASVVGRGGARRRARAHTRWRARRSARARTRSSRRSPPTRWASTTIASKSRSPTPRTVPNSGPTVASRTCDGRRQAGRDRGARAQDRR